MKKVERELCDWKAHEKIYNTLWFCMWYVGNEAYEKECWDLQERLDSRLTDCLEQVK
jgi:hypothetical protein